MMRRNKGRRKTARAASSERWLASRAPLRRSAGRTLRESGRSLARSLATDERANLHLLPGDSTTDNAFNGNNNDNPIGAAAAAAAEGKHNSSSLRSDCNLRVAAPLSSHACKHARTHRCACACLHGHIRSQLARPAERKIPVARRRVRPSGRGAARVRRSSN